MYVVVETEDFQEKKVSINVKQGKEKGIEEEHEAIMLKDDQDQYHTQIITTVGGMKDTEYHNKDDFADMAIFKVSIDTVDKDRKKRWTDALEKAKDKKVPLYLLVDAHTLEGQTEMHINYLGDTEEGEIRGEKVTNRWLDVDGAWFELDGNKRAPWMEIALEEAKKAKGVKEGISPMYKMAKSYLVNAGNNFEPTDGNYGPWCAAFMNWCIKKSGLSWAKSASSLAPIHPDTKKYFKKIEQPIYGCIVVYKHVDSKKWKGHTGFLYGMTKKDKYLLLGGNQADTIKMSAYGKYTSKSKKKKLYGFYIPSDYKVTKVDYLTSKDKNLNIDEQNKKLGITTTKSSGKTT